MQALGACAHCVAGKMLLDTGADIVALADVQQAAVGVEKPVNARRFRQGGDNAGIQPLGQRGFADLLGRGSSNAVGINAAQHMIEKLPGGLRITKRAVARVVGNAEPGADGIKTVAAELRKQFARQAHRAQLLRCKAQTEAAEFRFQESVIKTRVVGDEHTASEQGQQFIGNVGETRRIRDHGVVDAGDAFDVLADARVRLHQSLPALADRAVIDADHADFNDPIRLRADAGGFQIDNRQRRFIQLHGTSRQNDSAAGNTAPAGSAVAHAG